jgi:catechol 2,3-dioxygenase-like lactoylglutathione lyase family enzyme
LFSNDPKRLAAFYVERLGFREEKDEILPKAIAEPIFRIPSDLRFIRLARGSLKLELFKPVSSELKESRPDAVGYHHWGYVVPDRETVFKSLKQNGVRAIEVERGGRMVYFVEDPDGNRIEIRE